MRFLCLTATYNQNNTQDDFLEPSSGPDSHVNLNQNENSSHVVGMA